MYDTTAVDRTAKPRARKHDIVDYYTRAVNRYPLLTKEEEYEMACAIRNGDVSKERLFIQSNLRLVLKIASHYRHRGLAFCDLIEEGNMGLMHAVKRFDPDKGFRFATYAVWWVRQSIERALMSQTRTIRLPIHVVKRLSRCVRLGEKAAHMASQKQVSDVQMAQEANVSVGDVRFLMSHRHNTVSLEHKSYGDSEKELMDFVSDTDSPEENVSKTDLRAYLAACMGRLSEMELSILSARFGFEDEEELSFTRIAEKFSLSRDQVRRMLQQALLKIRQHL